MSLPVRLVNLSIIFTICESTSYRFVTVKKWMFSLAPSALYFRPKTLRILSLKILAPAVCALLGLRLDLSGFLMSQVSAEKLTFWRSRLYFYEVWGIVRGFLGFEEGVAEFWKCVLGVIAFGVGWREDLGCFWCSVLTGFWNLGLTVLVRFRSKWSWVYGLGNECFGGSYLWIVLQSIF